MTVSCCPIKCFMIKQNVRERLFDYSLEGLFFLQFFADLWHDGPQAGVKYYYYVVAWYTVNHPYCSNFKPPFLAARF